MNQNSDLLKKKNISKKSLKFEYKKKSLPKFLLNQDIEHLKKGILLKLKLIIINRFNKRIKR